MSTVFTKSFQITGGVLLGISWSLIGYKELVYLPQQKEIKENNKKKFYDSAINVYSNPSSSNIDLIKTAGLLRQKYPDNKCNAIASVALYNEILNKKCTDDEKLVALHESAKIYKYIGKHDSAKKICKQIYDEFKDLDTDIKETCSDCL